ncbi:MAG: LysM domain-containing protein [Patescibacteria group bacterium]
MYKIFTKKIIIITAVIWAIVLIGLISFLFLSSSPKAIEYFTEETKKTDQYQTKMESCLKEISPDALYGIYGIYSLRTIDDIDKNDEYYAEIEKTFHSKRGTIVDMYGDPIQEHIEMYLDPIPCTGLSDNAKRLTFTTGENGGFEFFVEELGGYTLSLQDAWYLENTDLKPVDFRNGNDGYRLVVRNEEHDREMLAKYIKTVEYGETLWSIATEHYGQGYYWPLIARANNLKQDEGIPEIFPGDELVVTPIAKLSQSQLEEIRQAFHAEDFGVSLNITNRQFNYSIDYPGRWVAQSPLTRGYDSNAKYYDSYIHEQKIIGPEYRQEYSSNNWEMSFVTVFVYDNREDKTLEEFAVYRDITDQSVIDMGHFVTEEWENGGILLTGGYYNRTQHLFFLKDKLIYDIAFSSLFSVEQTDPGIHQEMLDMIHSFKFVD